MPTWYVKEGTLLHLKIRKRRLWQNMKGKNIPGFQTGHFRDSLRQ